MRLWLRTPKPSALDGLEQRKKAALGRGLWELFRHTRCREPYFGVVEDGAAGLVAGFGAGVFAGALDAAGAGTPDLTL